MKRLEEVRPGCFRNNGQGDCGSNTDCEEYIHRFSHLRGRESPSGADEANLAGREGFSGSRHLRRGQ